MKNVALFLFVVALSGTCFAQAVDTATLVTKRGRIILPQQGEFAIGVDAAPFFQYIGNMFNNSTNNASPAFRSPSFPSLVLKYMSSANMAYRVRFAANNLSQEGKNSVDNVLSPDPAVTVTDTKSYSSTSILLGAGIEKRRGKGRLQGIYGVEAFIGFASSSSTYTYGNAITTTATSVPFTLWVPNSVAVAGTITGSTRTLETTSGSSISYGVTGFVGAEYFFAPKMSLGGEFGYSISSIGSGSGTQKTQSFNFGSNTVETNTADYFPTPSTFSIGTVATGSLFLNLYF